jgi:hypothetical protein
VFAGRGIFTAKRLFYSFGFGLQEVTKPTNGATPTELKGVFIIPITVTESCGTADGAGGQQLRGMFPAIIQVLFHYFDCGAGYAELARATLMLIHQVNLGPDRRSEVHLIPVSYDHDPYRTFGETWLGDSDEIILHLYLLNFRNLAHHFLDCTNHMAFHRMNSHPRDKL